MFLVAKPAGPTSHDVVDRARRALGTERVGHLGTLDPFAEGLLVLVSGRATRLAPYAGAWTKSYEGTARLGITTDTDDASGKPLDQSDAWRRVDRPAAERALAARRGRHEQRPPAFSAVKVDGVRAYKRARRGENVAPASRTVDVHELELTRWAPPEFDFRATVSAGTYLRSLVRDVGQELGCGAHLTRLVRTAVGPFRLADASPAEELSGAAARGPEALVADLLRRDLSHEERALVTHGRPVPAGDATGTPVALFAEGALVAIAERAEVEGGAVLKPRVVVADA